MKISKFIIDRLVDADIPDKKRKKLIDSVVEPVLSDFQSKFIGLKNKKLAIGAKVILKYTETGNAPEWNDTGIIKKITDDKFMPVITVKWSDDKKTDVWAFMIDFENGNFMLTKKELTESIYKKITESANRTTEERKDQDKRIIASLTNDVRHYTGLVQTLEKDIEKYKAATYEEIKTASLIEEIELARKLKTIEKIYFSENHIVVVTKKLETVFDGETHDIGRFVFNIRYDLTGITGDNLDFMYESGYPHPCISGDSICFGNNASEVKAMLTSGRLFALIDFLVTFVQTFENGSPYINYLEWLEGTNARTGKSELLRPEL